MLDLSEFQTSRLYQSIFKKTKLEFVPILLSAGLSILLTFVVHLLT